MTNIKVPAIGESITEVTLIKWLKKNGDYVERDEVIAEFESEKATFEVNAEKAGVLKTSAIEGDTLNIGDTLAQIDETAQKSDGSTTQSGISISAPAAPVSSEKVNTTSDAEPTVAAGKGTINIKIPTVGESITEVTLIKWLKKEGESVQRDEVIAELESEKATFELNAEEAGKLSLKAKEGETLKVGDVIASIDTNVAVGSTSQVKPAQRSEPAAPAKPATVQSPVTAVPNDIKASPVAAAIIADKKVEASSITASGANGKIMKNDVLQAISNPGKKAVAGQELFSRNERTEKMSNLRKTVSRRLVEAKNTTAMLTTFNEVDMSRIMGLRTQFKDKFKEKHGTNLGFMSFFTKAVCYALQEWPSVNAYIDGDSIIYHDYCDISIAVSAPKGLVVPVI